MLLEMHAHATEHSPCSHIDAYLQDSEVAGSDFLRQVQLFLARADMSIAAFEVKTGHGESENLQRVIVEAEAAMERFTS